MNTTDRSLLSHLFAALLLTNVIILFCAALYVLYAYCTHVLFSTHDVLPVSDRSWHIWLSVCYFLLLSFTKISDSFFAGILPAIGPRVNSAVYACFVSGSANLIACLGEVHMMLVHKQSSNTVLVVIGLCLSITSLCWVKLRKVH